MRAFRTKVTKTELLKSLHRHRESDRIQRGNGYWDHKNSIGCAVGCTLHDFLKNGQGHAFHNFYEILFGIPEGLAIIEDAIFERMGNSAAKEWPIKFIESIRVGSDLSNVVDIFIAKFSKGSSQYEIYNTNSGLIEKLSINPNQYEISGVSDVEHWYAFRCKSVSWNQLADGLIEIIKST